jgi:hypothetical protein
MTAEWNLISISWAHHQALYPEQPKLITFAYIKSEIQDAVGSAVCCALKLQDLIHNSQLPGNKIKTSTQKLHNAIQSSDYGNNEHIVEAIKARVS